MAIKASAYRLMDRKSNQVDSYFINVSNTKNLYKKHKWDKKKLELVAFGSKRWKMV